jgi:lipopolysaccharide transport system ATP-binding protein
MTRDLAIEIEGLGKRFQLGPPPSLAGFLRGRARRSHDGEFWALRDVSLAIPRGEALGIVGRNGAGKSTLLKILARVTEPTTGRAIVRGRIGSLLEVGTGFHPELSGRENVYLNGAILGLRKREITARFDEIVEFSGVERFIDTPVKRYSSGMRLRLAFAVAAHLEPEILVIDEVLAVGDAEFQRRCLGKMGDVTGRGRTVLFVSHNLAALRSLCTRAVWLDAGRVAAEGAPQAVLDAYLAAAEQRVELPLAQRRDRAGNGELRFTRVVLRAGDAAREDARPTTGRPLEIALAYTAASGAPLKTVRVAVLFLDAFGNRVLATDTRFLNADFRELPPAGEIVCRIPDLPLATGHYQLNVWATVADEVADHVEEAIPLRVEDGDVFGTGRTTIAEKHGPFVVRHGWDAHGLPDDDAVAAAARWLA